METLETKLKPAAPVHSSVLLAGRPMSLRDYYAGLAMQGMITQVGDPECGWIASHAWEMADAMIARRNRKSG